MSAAETYERIRAACADETGLSEEEREAHIRAITMLVLQVKGALR